VSRQRIAGAIILLLLAVLLPIRFAENAAATGTPDVLQPSDIAVANLVTHGDGSVTATDCRSTTPLTNMSTTYAAVTMSPTGSAINQVPKTVDGWTTKSCEETSVAGTDNAFFVSQSKNGLVNHRLAAYKNNAVRWAKTYECASGGDLLAQSLTLGSDGNIYGIFYEPDTTCSELSAYKKMLIAISVTDGSELFREVFTVTEEWTRAWLFAQEDRLVVKTDKELLFFEPDGDALTSQTLTPGGSGKAFLYPIALSDDDDVVYVRTASAASPRPSACTGFNKKHTMYVQQGTSSAVDLAIPDCEYVYDIEMLSGGAIAYLYRDLSTDEWKLKQRSVSGTVYSDVLVSGLSGYMIYMDALIEEDILTASGDGSLYLKRRLREFPGGLLTDTNLRVDEVSSSGTLTQVFSTSELDNPDAQQAYSALGVARGGLAGDKLYVPYCSGSYCNQYSTPKIAVADISVGFDYPRSSIFASHEQLNYVALGDSFSSGEGVEPFEPNTAIPSTNECHRSEKAYSKVLSDTPGSRLNLTKFVACSGATTSNIINSIQWDEGSPQYSALSGADVVTISVGGNDVSFAPTIERCVIEASGLGPAGDCDDALDASEAQVDALDVLLSNALDKIKDEIGSQTEVYVVGYPHILPQQGTTFIPACSGRVFSGDGLGRIWNLTDSLNDVIFDEVIDAGSQFHYVDTTVEFNGHELCTVSPYFNDAIPFTNQSYWYHPNEEGQKAYARAVTIAIS